MEKMQRFACPPPSRCNQLLYWRVNVWVLVGEVREVIKTGNPVNKENLTLKTNPEVIPEGSSHLSAPWLNIHCLPPRVFLTELLPLR